MSKSMTPTWEQHLRMGALLKQIHDSLSRMEAELGNRYGAGSTPRRRATRAVGAVLQLRAELDRRVYQEFTEKDTALVYYPRTHTELKSEREKPNCKFSDLGRPLGYATREEAEVMLKTLVEECLPGADGGSVDYCSTHVRWHIWLEGCQKPLEAAEVGE